MAGKIGRPRTGNNPNFSIRIVPEVLQKARDAAYSQKKTIGSWLKEAIEAKIESEKDIVSQREVKK